jgi:DNA-binding NarL/FixJ family response regulator
MGLPPTRTHSAAMTSVFLVDDSALIRDRVRNIVAGTPGVELIGEAANAEEAIAGILGGQPDVVFLDLNLAAGNGFDVLRAVSDSAPGIDVYMLSNFSSYPYRQLAERLGARGYFDKTREFEQIRAVLAGLAETTQH